jgi:hypothetical protein
VRRPAGEELVDRRVERPGSLRIERALGREHPEARVVGESVEENGRHRIVGGGRGSPLRAI